MIRFIVYSPCVVFYLKSHTNWDFAGSARGQCVPGAMATEGLLGAARYRFIAWRLRRPKASPLGKLAKIFDF